MSICQFLNVHVRRTVEQVIQHLDDRQLGLLLGLLQELLGDHVLPFNNEGDDEVVNAEVVVELQGVGHFGGPLEVVLGDEIVDVRDEVGLVLGEAAECEYFHGEGATLLLQEGVEN